MPQYCNPFVKGDLYIKMDVLFPQNNWINLGKLSELEDLLPSRPEVRNIIRDTEEVELQEFNSTRGSGAQEAGRGAKPTVTVPVSKVVATMGQECSVPISKPHPCALVGFQRFRWKVWSIQMNRWTFPGLCVTFKTDIVPLGQCGSVVEH